MSKLGLERAIEVSDIGEGVAAAIDYAIAVCAIIVGADTNAKDIQTTVVCYFSIYSTFNKFISPFL